MAMSSLLAALVTRTSFHLGETIQVVTAWDVGAALFAAGMCAWTVWFWQQQSAGVPKAESAQSLTHNDRQPAVEAGLVAD